MQSLFKILFYLGLVASVVSAAPSAVEKRTFKVERVARGASRPHNVPRQLLRAYTKHKFVVPPPGVLEGLAAHVEALDKADAVKARASNSGVVRRHRKKGDGKAVGEATNSTSNGNSTSAETGEVTNTPTQNDQEFLSPVQIGGTQQLNLDFDTGSSDLWVFSNQLSAQQIGQHNVFDPAKSSSFKQLKGATWNITYGDGSFASGTVGTETVNIGGATVTKQAVEIATDVAQSFTQDVNNEGLVGLAFSQLNTVQPVPQKTFLDNILPSLKEPVFTADLRKGARGTYEFGAVDTTKFNGSLQTAKVDASEGFWLVKSTSFAVGDGPVQTADPKGVAIVDTGTTVMLLNQNVATAYWQQVEGSAVDPMLGVFTAPCNAALPDFKVALGNTMATVRGADMNAGPISDGSQSKFYPLPIEHPCLE